MFLLVSIALRSGSFLVYRTCLGLGYDLGFSARCLSFEILLYLVEIIIMLLDLSYVEDMTFMLRCI